MIIETNWLLALADVEAGTFASFLRDKTISASKLGFFPSSWSDAFALKSSFKLKKQCQDWSITKDESKTKGRTLSWSGKEL